MKSFLCDLLSNASSAANPLTINNNQTKVDSNSTLQNIGNSIDEAIANLSKNKNNVFMFLGIFILILLALGAFKKWS